MLTLWRLYIAISLETKVEEIYDDTGVMIGYVSFKYPVLDSDDSGAKAVNSTITEDVERLYEEIMDTFTQAALKAADYVRDLYRQGGQEEYGLSGTGMQLEYAKESICIYQLKDGEILEGKEYLDEMIKNINYSSDNYMEKINFP